MIVLVRIAHLLSLVGNRRKPPQWFARKRWCPSDRWRHLFVRFCQSCLGPMMLLMKATLPLLVMLMMARMMMMPQGHQTRKPES